MLSQHSLHIPPTADIRCVIATRTRALIDITTPHSNLVLHVDADALDHLLQAVTVAANRVARSHAGPPRLDEVLRATRHPTP